MADTSKTSGSFQGKTEGNSGQSSRPGGSSSQGGDLKKNVQEGAHAAASRAGEVASNLGQRASEAFSSATSKASDLASQVGERAEDAVSTVGERMHSLGGAVRERGPRSGLLGSATSAVASGLEAGGDYLQEEGLSGMFSDVQSLVRRYPVASLCVGVGFGFLMARALSRE